MNIPVPLGPALPRHDRGNDEERYSRLMLNLFKPRRSAEDLCDTINNTWVGRFAAYRGQLSNWDLCIMENFQLLHECHNSFNDHMKRGKRHHCTPRHLVPNLGENEQVNAFDEEGLADGAGNVDPNALLTYLESINAT